MNVVVIPILRYGVFNFGQLTSTTEEIVIADRIPVAPFAKLGLSVRQHAKNIGAGHRLAFVVRYVNPSDEDGQDFVNTTTPVGSTPTIDGSGGAALLELDTGLVTLSGHPMVRVVLSVGADSVASQIFAVFSADLILKVSG